MLAVSMLFNPAWVRIDVLRDAALSWHIPAAAPLTRGARLYMDAPPGGGQLTAIGLEGTERWLVVAEGEPG